MKRTTSNLKNEFHKIKWPAPKTLPKSLILCIAGVAAICILSMVADSIGLALVGLIA